MRATLHVQLLTALIFSLPSRIRSQTCNVYEDICPYPLEGECDAFEGGPCPPGSDCFDCDPCQVYNLDCRSCVQNGCVWCPSDAICISQPLGEDFWDNSDGKQTSSCTSEGDWKSTCTVDPYNVFYDPLYSAQKWAYEILNVEDVWREGFTGKGVMVRINDPDGVAVDHPELSERFDKEASCDVYLPPDYESNNHGTAVASLAVGGSDNNQCAVGIAPGASLSACLGPTELTDENAAAFFRNGLDTTHISVNAWGFDACVDKIALYDDDDNVRHRFLQQSACPFTSQDDENPCIVCQEMSVAECEEYISTLYCRVHYYEEYAGCAEFLDLFVSCNYNALSDVGQAALTRGVQEGRDGKGIIYLFASGNEFDIYEDVNMEGWLNSRMTITCGAVDKNGKHASYSSGGSALFISGPGGDFDSLGNNIVASPGGGCADASVGTSFSTPSVAGAIALVLEANPNLGWRDVQGILASTAQQADPEHPSWATNGAGFHHSNLYGFGVMDAKAAVNAAKTWENFGPEKQLVSGSGIVYVAIPDDESKQGKSTISINETDFSMESVVVYLQLDHESRGDLEVVLTSPSGTQSVLHPPLRPENRHLEGEERWKLMTVRNWGENPMGDWTLTLTDHNEGNLGDCVNQDFLLVLDLDDGTTGLADCESLEAARICEDGTVNDSEVDNAIDENNGLSGREACCACGGGRPTSDVNALISWRLVIYGHGAGGTSAEVEVTVEDENPTTVSDGGSQSSSTSKPRAIGLAGLIGVVSFATLHLLF